MIANVQTSNETVQEMGDKINIIDGLVEKTKLEYFRGDRKVCLCCYSRKYLLFCIIFAIIFTILCLSTLIKNNKYYKSIKTALLLLRFSDANQEYVNFWNNIGKYETGILVPCLIFLIILFIFFLLLYLKYTNKINIEINQGKFYYFLLILHFVFQIILSIIEILLFYLVIYSFIVVIEIPYDAFDDLWRKKGTVPSINLILTLILLEISYRVDNLFPLSMKACLDMDFDEKQRIKTGKLCINDSNFDISIKSGYLCLLFIEGKKINDFYEIVERPLCDCDCHCCCYKKFLGFKEIFIKNIINEYIYILLENPLIVDQLPLANEGYDHISQCFFIVFKLLLILSIPYSKCVVNNDKYYNELKIKNAGKNIRFYNYFKNYGNFQKNLLITRIIYFSILSILLFILTIIRLIYGGIPNNKFIRSTLILYILLSLIIFIDIIFAFLNILFSLFSIYAIEGDEDKGINEDHWKFKIAMNFGSNCLIFFGFPLLQKPLTSFIYFLRFPQLQKPISSFIYYLDIFKRKKKLNETMNDSNSNKELVFDYIGLDQNKKKLNEFIIQGFPKNLFFKPEGGFKKNENEINQTQVALQVNNNIIVNNNNLN